MSRTSTVEMPAECTEVACSLVDGEFICRCLPSPLTALGVGFEMAAAEYAKLAEDVRSLVASLAAWHAGAGNLAHFLVAIIAACALLALFEWVAAPPSPHSPRSRGVWPPWARICFVLTVTAAVTVTAADAEAAITTVCDAVDFAVAKVIAKLATMRTRKTE